MVLPFASLAQEEIWKPYDENGNPIRTDRDATGTEGVVASSNFYASRVGLDILKQGGNAI
jgi:gamma-glutamyltranspeptidase/glutathione hydrolase